MPSYARIVQLDWKYNPNGWYAFSQIGEFRVRDGCWWLIGRTLQSAEMRDDDTAKASAQAYFESVIRSALEPE